MENRKNLRLHYEIYRNADPWLAEAPFAVKGWKPGLSGCVDDGLNLSAAPVPLPKGMPFYGSWQLKLNTSSSLRVKVWDILASFDNSDFWEFFDKRAIQKKILWENLDSKDLVMAWNFIGSFFYYHGLELPVKIQKLNHLNEKPGLFETKKGIHGCVVNYKPMKKPDQEKAPEPEFTGTPQICAECAAFGREDLRDTEKYHMPVSEKALEVLTVYGWNELSSETDAVSWLQKACKPGYLLFFCSRGNVPEMKDEGMLAALGTLGLKEDFFRNGKGSYLAVLDGGQAVYEKQDPDHCLRQSGTQDGVTFSLYSGNYKNGNEGYMTVNDVCYWVSVKNYGVVAYDKIRKDVVDFICLDGNAGFKLKRRATTAPWISEVEKLKKKEQDLKNSISYRVGRKITAVPRKLRDAVKHAGK